eukprot:3925840-Rhodomonas_salina.1
MTTRGWLVLGWRGRYFRIYVGADTYHDGLGEAIVAELRPEGGEQQLAALIEVWTKLLELGKVRGCTWGAWELGPPESGKELDEWNQCLGKLGSGPTQQDKQEQASEAPGGSGAEEADDSEDQQHLAVAEQADAEERSSSVLPEKGTESYSEQWSFAAPISNWFRSDRCLAEHPNYAFDDTPFDIEYVYLVDMDDYDFYVSTRAYSTSFKRFPINNIPDDWIDRLLFPPVEVFEQARKVLLAAGYKPGKILSEGDTAIVYSASEMSPRSLGHVPQDVVIRVAFEQPFGAWRSSWFETHNAIAMRRTVEVAKMVKEEKPEGIVP